MQETEKGIVYPDTDDDIQITSVLSAMAHSIDEAMGYPRIAAGKVVTVGAANTTRVHSVTLPVGFFTQDPVFQVAIRTSNPQNGQVAFSASSASSFNVYLRYTTATNITVNWLAVQISPDNAES